MCVLCVCVFKAFKMYNEFRILVGCRSCRASRCMAAASARAPARAPVLVPGRTSCWAVTLGLRAKSTSVALPARPAPPEPAASHSSAVKILNVGSQKHTRGVRSCNQTAQRSGKRGARGHRPAPLRPTAATSCPSRVRACAARCSSLLWGPRSAPLPRPRYGSRPRRGACCSATH